MDSVVKPLSLGVAIRQGWLGFKNNLAFYLISILTMFVVQIGYSYYMNGAATPEVMEGPNGQQIAELPPGVIFGHFIGFLAYIIFALGFFLGIFRASIEVIRGGKASFSHYFQWPGDLWRAFLGYILYGLIILAGIILLIFPAIIWGVRYMFFPYLIADKHVGPVDSLKLSSQATYGAKWDLLGFVLVIDLLWLPAALTIGLGLFIVTPLWALTKAALYVKLTKDAA